jgi:hypothetical protein
MRRLAASVLACAIAVGVPLSGQARAAMVVGTWPVGRAPLSLATDPATGKIYVANSETATPDGPGRISVVDPVTGSVSSLTTTLTANFVLVDGPARKLYSSNSTYAADQTSVDIFDLDTGARTSIANVGGLSLGLDAGAGRLFAGGHVLTVIDTATHEIKRTLPAPPFAAWFGVAVDPGDRRVYLSNPAPSSQGIFAFDYNERDELTSAWANPVTPPTAVRYALAVDPVGHRLLAAGSDTSGGGAPSAFYVITPSGTIAGTTPIAGFPNGIALAPAAHRIYVATMTSQAARGAIYALSDAYELTETVETPFAPGQPLPHADGRLYVGNYVTVGDYNRFWAPDSTLKALDMANHAPVVTVTLDPANPRTDQTVTATVDAHDPDLRPMGAADPTTWTYEWLRNGTVISGQTGATLDLRVAGNGDHGDRITVRVTASDGQLTSTASASVTVANSAPTATVSLNILSPKTNDVLIATTDASDADGDALTYTYTWTVNGALKRTATTASNIDRFDLKAKGNGDKGDVVTVTVTVSDGAGASTTATASATVR